MSACRPLAEDLYFHSFGRNLEEAVAVAGIWGLVLLDSHCHCSSVVDIASGIALAVDQGHCCSNCRQRHASPFSK